MKANNDIYYVYMYLREDLSPYYVGKGKHARATYKYQNEIKPNKDKSNIRFIIENISEDEAFMWEEFWIDFFGRIDLGTGCLRNKTKGGEGATGVKREIVQCEWCDKEMTNANYIKWHGSKCPENPLAEKRIIPHRHCNYCNKIVDSRNFAQYHSNKCIENPNRLPDVLYQCQYCSVESTKTFYNRDHGNKCKHNPSYVPKSKNHRCCPHCQLTGSGAAMTRYHFDNCKYK